MFDKLNYMQFQAISVLIAAGIVTLVIFATWRFIKWMMGDRVDEKDNVLFAPAKEHWLDKPNVDNPADIMLKEWNPETSNHPNPRSLSGFQGDELQVIRSDQVPPLGWRKGLRTTGGQFISKKAFEALDVHERVGLILHNINKDSKR